MLYNIYMKISTRIIFRLKRRILKNKRLMRKKEAGIPVAAVLYYGNGEIIYSANNKKTINGIRDYKTHAEMICINNNNSTREKLNMIVTTPPCKECFADIKKLNKIQNIYWLFDKYGKNSVKEDDIINIEQFIPKNAEEIKMIEDMKKIYFKFEKYKNK